MSTLTICILIWVAIGLAMFSWIAFDKYSRPEKPHHFIYLLIISIIAWPVSLALLLEEIIEEKYQSKKRKKK